MRLALSGLEAAMTAMPCQTEGLHVVVGATCHRLHILQTLAPFDKAQMFM